MTIYKKYKKVITCNYFSSPIIIKYCIKNINKTDKNSHIHGVKGCLFFTKNFLIHPRDIRKSGILSLCQQKILISILKCDIKTRKFTEYST